MSDLGFAMCQEPQQTVNRQVQQDINDDRDYHRQQKRMSFLRSRAGDNSAKGFVKRIRDRHDELNESSGTARGKERQQKPQAQQGVEHKEKVVDYLRNASQSARAFYFVLSFDYFIDGFSAKVSSDRVDLSRLWRRSLTRAIGYFSVNLAFDLGFDALVLHRTSRFFRCKFVIVHDQISDCQMPISD
jgi:hypothetical protein